MKKKKFALFFNIASICLSICAIVIGVYSVKNTSVKVGGTIGFVSSSCNVKITPSITGFAPDGTKQTYTENAVEIGGNSANSMANLTMKKVYFNDTQEDGNIITISLKIENLSNFDVIASIKSLTLKKNESEIESSVVRKQVQNNGVSVSNYANIKLDKSTSASNNIVTITITLTASNLKDIEQDVINDSKFDISINFKKYAVAYLAPNWKPLVFTEKNGNDYGICKVSELSELIFTDKKPIDCDLNYISVGTSSLDMPKDSSTLLGEIEDVIAYFKKDSTTNKYTIYMYSPGIIYIGNKSNELGSEWDDQTWQGVDKWETNLSDGNQFSSLSMSTLDMGNADFSYVSTAKNMFKGCSGLTQLDVNMLDTSKITDMSNMFFNCTGLTNIDLASFNTEKVINMNKMFSYCTSLSNLCVNYFNTCNVTDMGYMFNNCKNLSSLYVNNFDTSKVTDMRYMFSDCKKLSGLNLANFNTSKVTYMSDMFRNCSGLTSINISNFNTSNVTDMSGMFESCNNLANLNLKSFDTSKVTTMASMFYNCGKLTDLNVNNFDTRNVTRMKSMFQGCKNLSKLDLSNFVTNNVTNMEAMFLLCSALTSLNISSFNTSKVTHMGWMFEDCSSLTSLNLAHFDTSNVTNMYTMFSGCSALTSLNISSFVTTKANSLSEMFANCSELTNLDLSNFNTANVTDMKKMFFNCSKLEKIEVSTNWSIAKLERYYKEDTFTGCTSLNQNSSVAMKYDSTKTTADYAKTGTNGYLTLKSN